MPNRRFQSLSPERQAAWKNYLDLQSAAYALEFKHADMLRANQAAAKHAAEELAVLRKKTDEAYTLIKPAYYAYLDTP